MCSFVPFATCFGPTVYSDPSSGAVFGDPALEVTVSYANLVKNARNKHLRRIYDTDGNGYPTTTSSSFNLKRGVQVIMTRPTHTAETDVTEEQKQEVADYLLRERKGNFYIDNIDKKITMALVSYIECRKAGSAEPVSHDGGVYVQFEARMRAEQTFINSGKYDEAMAASKAAFEAHFGDA